MKFKNIFLFIFVLFYYCSAKGQSEIATDSLLVEMCNTISKNRNLADTLNFYKAYEKHIIPFYENLNEKEQERLYDNVIFRLQKNCKSFYDMLAGVSPPPKGDWERLDGKPDSKLEKAACSDFNSRNKYYYLEALDGDTVRVTIENNMWIEDFSDGTYSKLKFYWVTDCEFELEFISSNNKIRKNYSREGDKFRYGLLDKEKNYFSASAVVVGRSDYMKSKLYY